MTGMASGLGWEIEVRTGYEGVECMWWEVTKEFRASSGDWYKWG